MDKIKIIKKFLESRTFKFETELVSQNCLITFKVDIIKQVPMRNYIGDGFGILYNLKILDISYLSPTEDANETDDYESMTGLLRRFFREIFNKNPDGFSGEELDSFLWKISSGADTELKHFLKFMDIDDNFIFKLNNANYYPKEVESLNEHKMSRNGIRSIIKDIVKILKYEDEGSYELPEDINGEPIYNFSDIKTQFNVELNVTYDESIKTPNVDGGYYKEDDVITIDVTLNPMNIKQSLYSIIGELNDVMAHELEHLNQFATGSHDLTDNSEGEPLSYYSQPHEIDAQKKGFKRLSKLIRQPYENVVRNWFDTHKSTHKLSDTEIEQVIDLLV